MTQPSPYTITDQMVDDLVCTALEGGCNYWTAKVSVIGEWPKGAEYASDVLTKGASLKWIEQCDGERKVHTLTLAKMKRGIRKASEAWNQTPLAFYEDHDATSADVAVQFALFGEVVFG